MSAAGDHLSAAAQHLPDIERRRCWSILEAGFLSVKFHWFLPRMPSDQKNERWLCTRRSSFYWEKRVAVEALLLVMAPFRTEAVLTVLHRNDPPWPRPDSAVRTRLPVLHGLARSATIRSLKIEWTSRMRCACDDKGGVEKKIATATKKETFFVAVAIFFFSTPPWWNMDRDRSRARTQWARISVDFETKLETSRGVHWQRWTPRPPPPFWYDPFNLWT